MPRYFFNLRSDVDADDPEGTELADEAAARDYALENARELVCADVKQGWLNLDHSIEIADESGRVMTAISFRDAFTFGDPPSRD